MYKHLFFAISLLSLLSACHKDPVNNNNQTDLSNIENTYGYGILEKVEGIWNGPVTSTTSIGSFPQWIVDFRPISASQISAKNELDSGNDIFMSLFIAKYNNEYRVCFRNGGKFGGFLRTSYFLADSVYETSAYSYYRFAEIINGTSRAYSEFTIKDDSLILTSYTNHNNTQTTASQHMQWKAKLQDKASCQNAIDAFDFPQKTLSKDIGNAFGGLTESIVYQVSQDPYPESAQPYLGTANLSYTLSAAVNTSANGKVMLMVTTQPLFSGVSFSMNNLKYISRYVLLPLSSSSFEFNYMHPGSYYLYALYDADNNNTFSSGDWLSATNTAFSLVSLGTTSSSTQISFQIP